MRDAGREVPDVALGDVVDEAASVLVDRREARAAGQHVAPLGLLVPVHLAHAAGLEAHVDAGEVLGDRQFTHGDLARLPGAAEAPRGSRSARRTRAAGRASADAPCAHAFLAALSLVVDDTAAATPPEIAFAVGSAPMQVAQQVA